MEYEVVAPKLSGIKIQGSADVIIEDEVKGEEFSTLLSGSGNVRAKLSVSIV